MGIHRKMQQDLQFYYYKLPALSWPCAIVAKEIGPSALKGGILEKEIVIFKHSAAPYSIWVLWVTSVLNHVYI